MYLGVIRSRPTAWSKITIQHNHLMEKYLQNQKYRCKINVKLIYITFIHCTNKFEKHKQSFLSENCERTLSNKGDDWRSNQSGNAPTRHANARATSADSIPVRSLKHPDFIDKNSSL